jgi:hypothetical protein
MEELKLSLKLLFSLMVQIMLFPFRFLSICVKFIGIVVRVISKTIDSFIKNVIDETIK